MSIPRIIKVNLSAKRIRKRVVNNRTYKIELAGGPVESLFLSCPGSLIFTLGEFSGFYNSKNEWVQI
jgi:hypothetical protein